jgi:beta-1,4-mannooligosaccharide/beta-1,4-mannosyl-N-acetylglucosamine phosphorylase
LSSSGISRVCPVDKKPLDIREKAIYTDEKRLGYFEHMKRCPQNPIVSRSDIPCIKPYLMDISSVFNPGAVRSDDQIVLLLRIQNRGRETSLLPAFSRDGVAFEIAAEPIRFHGLEKPEFPIYHIYDPRITRIDESYYITLAMDTDSGCRIGLARTSDFRRFAFLGILLDEDARNAVLFPEKIKGEYIMLYRPNRSRLDGGISSGSEIALAVSQDLLNWTPKSILMKGRFHYWDELIGSGPPPIKTRAGWLHIYHGVATHFAACNIYQAGVVLLDLNHPEKVIGRSRYNILEPRELYELTGQVPNVVFPTGLVPALHHRNGFVDQDAELLLYYGAADTCVGLATTTVRELLEACDEV